MLLFQLWTLVILAAIWTPCMCFDDEAIGYIRHYFRLGYSNSEILGFLLLVHNIFMSLRTIQRILRQLGLRRNRVQYNYLEIIRGIRRIRNEGKIGYGYKMMYYALNARGVRATERIVRAAMKILDQDGVNYRRMRRLRRRAYVNKGPNYLLHIDGHDKLKPFGIAIHGAIDGYSRRIVWLKAGFTNNDPEYIARFYLEHVLETMRLPKCIRSDDGTENGLLRCIHEALRSFHNDSLTGHPVFMTGRSTANQRIEMFWGILHRAIIVFWKHLFKDLRDSGLFQDSNPVHIECLRFCFLKIIQSQLDEFTENWNRHRIRQQRNVETPCGIPDVLYYQPELYGSVDYSMPFPVTRDSVSLIMDMFTKSFPVFGCNEEFVQLLEILSNFGRADLVQPVTVSQGISLFTTIINALP